MATSRATHECWHDPRLGARCDYLVELVELVDGKIARDEPVSGSKLAG